MTRSGPPRHCSLITASLGHAAEPTRIPDLRNTRRRHHARPIGIAQECSSCNRSSRSFHSQPYRMPRLRLPWLARRSRPRPQPPELKAGMQNSSLNVSLCFLHGHIARIELRRHCWGSYAPHVLVIPSRVGVAQKLPGRENVRTKAIGVCNCLAREQKSIVHASSRASPPNVSDCERFGLSPLTARLSRPVPAASSYA